jgi:hypothetical protein
VNLSTRLRDIELGDNFTGISIAETVTEHTSMRSDVFVVPDTYHGFPAVEV